MAMVADRRSRLNPHAPVFVPNAAYGEVEDFSPEWWDLVKTSPWFRDYWLSQYEDDDFTSIVDDYFILELDDLVDDDIDQRFESEEKSKSAPKEGREKVNGVSLGSKSKALLKDLNLDILKYLKGKGPKSPVGSAKFSEKPAKYVNPKCTPRRIHQPR